MASVYNQGKSNEEEKKNQTLLGQSGTTGTAATQRQGQAAAGGAADTAQQYLQTLKSSGGANYKSPFAGQLEAVLQQITGRGPFQYDAATDPLYNIYKDLYMQNGRRAMEDTIGQASALTGGYGNSYAQAAGQQQYNQYMEGLNAMIPQFQQQAYEQYKGEGDMLAAQYQILSDADNTAYARYKEQQQAAQAAQYAAALAAQQAAGQQGTQATETAGQIQNNATAFLNYVPTEKEFNERKKTSSVYQTYPSYENYITKKLESFLRSGRLTDNQADAVMDYFGIRGK